MKKTSLVIVESPTKAKTLGKILGKSYCVVASYGHLIDLPASKLGVEIEKGFQPSYEVIHGRNKTLTMLKKESKNKEDIFVATDPDREGEAIGWHIKNKLFNNKKVWRVVFHEITPQAVKEAFKNPRDFDLNMVEAQIGRRVLDRLVGYFLSPLLWKKIARGLSAGRVQSVALRQIVEREKQINNFKPQEYWEIEAKLVQALISQRSTVSPFSAKLIKIGDKKAEIKDKAQADSLVADIKNKQFIVSQVKQAEKKRSPYAPFITSTLQQDAFNKLRFNANKTMRIAQQLYEGIDIGQESPVGLITYMRTDSTHVAEEALNQVRVFIAQNYGKDYLPAKPNFYKVKKHVQAAHEAIRPTLISHRPENLKNYLTPDQYKLYELIYRRFLASQMTPARYLNTSVEIKAENYIFSASGFSLIFDGFLACYNLEEEENKEKKDKLPELKKDETLKLIELITSQHFTKAPPRFSDSSLIKILEEEGIGRPSTYAPIIYTLILRHYIRRIKGYFHPTELGCMVSDLLVEYFPRVMNVKFTATMEEELDEIEEGQIGRLKVLQDFYLPFKENLDFAQKHIKKEVIVSDQICDKCGKPMVVKWGRKGKFLSCSDFPNCKNSKAITTGVKCPQAGCNGELVERYSRRGHFYGCTNYPKCRFISNTLPEPA
ncbi:MAG: type I DNA topoisomerase [Candidatus Omnitrophota bacterium]|nr:MAG: type I DNA topoisomerase [Candidatus Omnitrophota bacterium]